MLLSGGSSGAGPIELGVRMYLIDQFSGPVGRMQQAMTGLRGEYTAFQDNLRSARALATTAAAVGAGLSMGMGSAIKKGADFHYMMRSVEAISDATAQQIGVLSEQAIKLGRATMFFPKDIGSGMRFMAMAGQDAETIHKTIEASTNLAGATLTQLGGKMGAADILTNALKAFGWEAEKSAQMSDVLVLATNNANVSLNDVGNSIRYVAATARNLRVPVQETAGLLMTLGNAGIQASMAGVATENMLRYLGVSMSEFAPKRSQAAWSTLGIDRKQLLDAEGNLKPIVEILGMIKRQSEGMGSVQLQNILRDIFGVRGLRAAGTLLNNLEQTQGFIDLLNDPKNAGVAGKKMELMMDSVQGSIWRVQSAWDGLHAAFTKAVQGTVQPWLETLQKLIGGIAKVVSSAAGGILSKLVLNLTFGATIVWGLRAALLGVVYAFRTLNVSYAAMTSSFRMGWQMMTGKIATYKKAGHAAEASSLADMKNAKASDTVSAAAARTTAALNTKTAAYARVGAAATAAAAAETSAMAAMLGPKRSLITKHGTIMGRDPSGKITKKLGTVGGGATGGALLLKNPRSYPKNTTPTPHQTRTKGATIFRTKPKEFVGSTAPKGLANKMVPPQAPAKFPAQMGAFSILQSGPRMSPDRRSASWPAVGQGTGHPSMPYKPVSRGNVIITGRAPTPASAGIKPPVYPQRPQPPIIIGHQNPVIKPKAPSGFNPFSMGKSGASAMPGLMKSRAAVGAGSRILPGLLRVGGGLLRVLGGPWTFGIITLATLIPSVVRMFRKNTKAVEDNTHALKVAHLRGSNSEFYEVVGDRKVSAVVAQIAKNLEKLVQENHYDLKELGEILGGNNKELKDTLIMNALVNSTMKEPGYITR